jgi:hypothetical protein
VRAAFEQREPVRARRRSLRPVLALAAALLVAGVLASPPGWSLIHSIRKAVGVESASTELFSLPAPGRLLVSSAEGLWVVQRDGSRRLLRGYRDGAWSPHGLFLAATRPNELVALDPQGDVRWTLPRRDVGFPRWTGSRTDTRVAYLSGSSLRVVAGDGTGDRAFVDVTVRAAPAWRPGIERILAFSWDRWVQVDEGDSRRLVWRARFDAGATKLEWSSDGQLLLALSPFRLRVYNSRGRVVAQDDPSDGTSDADAAFLPGTHRVVVIRVHGAQSDVFELGTGRTLFRSTGAFRQIVPSPDGRWLLVSWPTANQWVFLRTDGTKRIVAVAQIARQFGGEFPHVTGWCCVR